MWQLIIEIIIVAFITAFVGTLLTFISMGKERAEFKQWWLIILIFGITGSIIHLLFEFTGLNKYYCLHGNACLAN